MIKPSDLIQPDHTAIDRLLARLHQPLGRNEADDQAKPRPPGQLWTALEFHDAVNAHGKPHSVFDNDRQLPYRG